MIKRHRFAAKVVAAVAVLVLVAESTVVLGQTTVNQERQIPGWVFTPSIGFGGSWDSNVLLANPGDNPPGDYGTPIEPSASLDYGGRRTRFSSGYEGSFLMYQTLSELNSADQRLRALLLHRATPRVTVFAEESFAAAPTTDALQLAGVPFYRIGSRSNMAGGGVEIALDKRTTLRTGYTLNMVDFDDDAGPDAALEGGYEHQVVSTLSRALSPRFSVGGQYELRRAILSDGNDRFNIQTGSATVQYLASPAVTISGSVGVSRLDAGLNHPARTGPALRAAVTRRFKQLLLGAHYQRSFIPSYGFGGTFQNQEFGGNAHIPFARGRAYADSSIAWFTNDALDVEQPSLKTLFFNGTLGFRATQWLSVEGYYGRTQQDTQRPDGKLGRNQLGFRVVAAKPLRLR